MPRKIKTHCVHGHERTPDNVGNFYECKACRRIASKTGEATRPKRAISPRKIAYDKEHRRLLCGWTTDAYNKAKEDQRNLCAICHKSSTVELAGDHDHETGQPRGLLCKTCNLLLGLAHDSPIVLEAAAAYLRKWRK